MSERIADYARLMRLDRPIGSLLLLWPTLWALWIAGGGQPAPRHIAVFVAGVFVMRAAGCIVNDLCDRDIDPHVERTRDRPLASGRLHGREALLLLLGLCAVALGLVLTLGRQLLPLAAAGLAIAAIYPLCKRFTQLPQVALGVAFSWGIPMAFMAETGALPALCWLLLAANLCWVVAYDTMYAMSDRPDDLRVGVKSSAILFGRYDRALVGLFQALALALLVLIGAWQGLNGYYYLGLALAAAFGLYQAYLCRERERQACFRAFVNNAWFGAAIFLGVVVGLQPA